MADSANTPAPDTRNTRKWYDWIIHPINSTEDKLSEVGSDLWQAGKTRLTHEMTDMGKTAAAESAKTAVAQVKAEVQPMIDGAKDMLKPVTDAVTSLVTPSSSVNADPLAFTGKDGAPQGQSTLQKMMNWGKDKLGGIGDFLGDAFDSKSGQSGLTGAIMGAVGGFMMGGPFGAILGLIAGLLFGPKIIEGVKSLFGGLGKMAGGLFGGHSADAGDTPTQQHAQGAGQTVGGATPEAPVWDRVKKQVGDTADKVGTWMGEAKDTVVHDSDIAIARTKSFLYAHSTSDAKQHALSAVDFFKEKGWTEAQATGIAANLMQESGFRIDAAGDKRDGVAHSHGIGQWQGKRLAAFKELYGHDITDKSVPEGQRRYEQLSFIDHELRTSEAGAGKSLAQAKTAEEAAAIFSAKFERPADHVNEPTRRAGIAQEIRTARAAEGHDVGHNDTVVAQAPAAAPRHDTKPAGHDQPVVLASNDASDQQAAQEAARMIRDAHASSKARLAMTSVGTSTTVTLQDQQLPAATVAAGGGRVGVPSA